MLTQKSLRDQMSFVLQDTVLFSGSIWDNIAYGKPEATYKEIAKAAEAANAMEFIEKLPGMFSAQVGERGVTLSGGQRQRIAIARAIVRQSPVLILDEPSSGLDAGSEQLVFEALDRLMQNRTSIVIAHRLSTIRDAACIYVVRRAESSKVGPMKNCWSGRTASTVSSTRFSSTPKSLPWSDDRATWIKGPSVRQSGSQPM